jgi:hypothetical protein
MATMLFINVGILLLDWAKTAQLRRESLDNLRAYWPWAALNVALGAVCVFGLWLDDPLSSIAAVWLSFIVFTLALLRTACDYDLGRHFMFP